MQTAQITPAGTIHVEDVEVRYYDSGECDSLRAPIVLVHGTAGSTEEQFGFLYPLLAKSGRVVSMDLQVPTTSGPLTLEVLEQQVTAIIDHVLPGQQVTVVGYSLGAVVAAAVAADRPETVSQLVLVAGWMRTDSQQLLFTRVWQDLRQSGSAAHGAYMFHHLFGGPFQAAQPLEALEPMIAMARADASVETQMRLNDTIDITERVGSITARTLVVACTHDQMVPVRHGKQLFGAIDNARYTEIESGHAVIFERPAELLRLIEHFTADPEKYTAGSIIPAARP